jgi:uncharacterized phage infection (PIP) family protein YhgE
MATDLERLTVLIESNTKSYERSMLRLQQQTAKAIKSASTSIKSLDSGLGSLAATAKSLGGVLGVSLGIGAFEKLAGVITDTVHSAAGLVDLADKIGITTDALQELRYQAEQNGSSAEALDSALSQFSKRIGEAATGSGELLKILNANGVALRDAAGNLRPLTDLLANYADLIKNASDDQARAVLATQAFGKAGDEMANVLRDGAAGMRAMGDEAQRTNQIIGEDALRSLEAYDDAIARLEGAWQKFVTTTVAGGLRIVSGLQETAQAINRLNDQLNGTVPQLQTVDDKLADIAREVAAVQALSASGLIDAAGLNADLARLGALHAELIALRKDADSGPRIQMSGSADRTKDDFIGPPPKVTVLPTPPLARGGGGGGHRAAGGGGSGGKSDVERQKEQVTELIKELERELSLVGKSETEQKVSNALRQAGAEATAAQKEQITGLVTQIEAQQTAYDNLIDTLDTVRDAAGGVMDAFMQSIQAGEGPIKALKASLLDLLQTIIRIGEQRAILALFGLTGTAGGGFLGRAVQQVAVHVTASPEFHVSQAKSSKQAEDRAVARGPAVARSNNLRYATP